MKAPLTDTTHQALAGCGERLRAAREAAGLSVDDVALRLHMPARVVRSLESEDWSRLGAPVFVRGQVRSYARLLGLTTAPMMEALNVGPVEPAHLVSRSHIPQTQWWAEQVGRRLIYIVLTLSLAVPAWIATRERLAAEPEAATPLDLPAGALGGVESAKPVAPRTVVASMAPMASPASAAAHEGLVIRTRAESWLEVVSPAGEVVEKGLLPAGSERRFAHAQVGRLTIGNASAVELHNLGRDVDLAPFARANVARFAVSSGGSLVAAD